MKDLARGTSLSWVATMIEECKTRPSANRGKYEITLHQSQPVTNIVADYRRFLSKLNQFPVIRKIFAYHMSLIFFWEYNCIMKLDTKYALIRSWWIFIGGSQLPCQTVCEVHQLGRASQDLMSRVPRLRFVPKNSLGNPNTLEGTWNIILNGNFMSAHDGW